MVSDEAVKLNVGGRIFETRASTILAYPDSTLACAYRHDKESLANTLWDRDPEIFELVIAFYRNGYLPPPPPHITMDRLTQELGFWGFDIQLPGPAPEDWPFDFDDNPNGVALPLCSLLLHLRGTGHLVHVCYLWRAIRSCGDLWAAASKGYRSMSIFWSNRPVRGTCASFVKDNVADLAWIAKRDGVTVTVDNDYEATQVNAVYRPQDTIVTGNLDSSSDEKDVHSATVQATVSMSNTIIHFYTTLTTSFEYRGITYELSINKNSVAVRTTGPCNPLQYMEDTRGAMMRLYVIVDDTMEFRIDDFAFPTPRGNTCRLTSDVFAVHHLSSDTDMDAVYMLNARSAGFPVRVCVRDATRPRLGTARVFSTTHPIISLTPITVTYSRLRLSW